MVHDSTSTQSRNFWLYINGEYTGNGKNAYGTVTDNGKEICVGNVSCDAAKADNGPGCSMDKKATGAGRSFCGQMDEIRIQSYANFDANREYFEGALAKDANLTAYSSAAPCANLAVDITFDVITRMNPAEIAFAATVSGATGACEYSWDFDNDGTIDRVGASANETWTCTKAGKYNARVQVKDANGMTGEVVTLDSYIVNDILYVDGDATVDGDGTPESPFNNLRSLAEKMNSGDKARIKGTLTVGDEEEAIAFAVSNVSFDKWGDDKPLIRSTTESYVAKSGILVFNGTDVVVSNLTFSFTKESFTSVNAVTFKGNDVEVVGCDFAAAGGTCAKMVGHKGVLGTGASQCNLLVSGCTFKGFRAGTNDCCAVLVNENATVSECVFEDVSSAIRANNGYGGSFNFVSNLVINAESQDLKGDNAGVVIRGAWSMFSGSTIAYNRFVNTGTKAGCLVYCRSKTGQDGINVHHNTLVGYKTLASFDSTTQEPWTFTFFDNLVVGCDCVYKDEKTTATYATQKAGYVRNNYHAGILRDVPDGYTFNEKMTVDGNVAWTGGAEPRFLRKDDPSSPDFYRVRVGNRKEPLVLGGWTDGGKYPTYIGAMEPLYVPSGMVIFVK